MKMKKELYLNSLLIHYSEGASTSILRDRIFVDINEAFLIYIYIYIYIKNASFRKIKIEFQKIQLLFSKIEKLFHNF